MHAASSARLSDRHRAARKGKRLAVRNLTRTLKARNSPLLRDKDRIKVTRIVRAAVAVNVRAARAGKLLKAGKPLAGRAGKEPARAVASADSLRQFGCLRLPRRLNHASFAPVSPMVVSPK